MQWQAVTGNAAPFQTAEAICRGRAAGILAGAPPIPQSSDPYQSIANSIASNRRGNINAVIEGCMAEHGYALVAAPAN